MPPAAVAESLREGVLALGEYVLHEDADASQAVVNDILVRVGPHMALQALNTVATKLALEDELGDAQTNIIIELSTPVVETLKAVSDKTYVQVNLSPEVEALVNYLCTDYTEKALKSGSPNWFMLPTYEHETLLALSQAAAKRHNITPVSTGL